MLVGSFETVEHVPPGFSLWRRGNADSSGHAGFRKPYNHADDFASAAWYTLESAHAAPTITLSRSWMELVTATTCFRTLTAGGEEEESRAPRFVSARPSPNYRGLLADCCLDKGCASVQVLCPNGDHVNGGPSLIAIGLTSSVRGSPMNELLDSTLGGRRPKQRKRAKQPLLCGSSSWQ